jgi:UDP-N-acetylmuramoyl-L-alanyl-D-glutamate--2,6-diaminopimelate ligase
MAVRNDVILVAGKGHEEYQIIGNVRSHFSDREVIEEWIG